MSVHRRPPRSALSALALVAALLLGVVGAGPATSAVEVEAQRLSGADRYATAAAAALASYPAGSNSIVLASGENFPDGLAAAFLSGSAFAPILLTARDSLPPATAAAIGTLDAMVAGPATIYVVGGNAAIGPNVRSTLVSLGYDLEEVGGANRYQTAANVAVLGKNLNLIGQFQGKRTAIVTTGENFPDALAAGALAQARHHPVLLTRSDVLSPETDLALGALDIEQVIILGGTGAVSNAVQTAIAGKGIAVIRVSGANRYGTATALANLLTTPEVSGGGGWDQANVVLARGTNFPDALAASQVGGRNEAPILLVDSTLPQDTRNHLQAKNQWIAHIFAMGGTGAISDATLQQAVDAATIDAPTATVAALGGNSEFSVTFSEPVTNADDPANYRLNNAALPGGTTIAAGPGTNEYTVTLGGGTTLAINDVILVNPPGGTIENAIGVRVAQRSFTVTEAAP